MSGNIALKDHITVDIDIYKSVYEKTELRIISWIVWKMYSGYFFRGEK